MRGHLMSLISEQLMRSSALQLTAKYGPLSWENKCLLSVLRTVNEKSPSSDVFWHKLNVQHEWSCWLQLGLLAWRIFSVVYMFCWIGNLLYILDFQLSTLTLSIVLLFLCWIGTGQG